ncbi:MAG TPA: PIN domain-containing protein [Thermoanaerobaculia bacterium]|nr:PIN domain-containing protein [Thermoanaerobaculia bacterium]
MYLLDTNTCFRLVASERRAVEALRRLGKERVVTAAVVAGELLYGASISERKAENLHALSGFLAAIEILRVGRTTAAAYANLKSRLLERFGPRAKLARRQFDLKRLGFHDNDLWIAASALESDATIVSDDRAFVRMREADARLEVVSWDQES